MKLHIRYWPDNGHLPVREENIAFERKIRDFFKKEGFAFYTSGWDIIDKRRDICFEKKELTDG
jgi:hypothetical protein